MSLLCRICACPSDLHIPIFSGEGAENDLLNKIHKHLPIQVSEDDKLPNEVCFECASTVCTWHDLVSKCVEADIKLRAMQNTESIKTDDDASRSSGTDDVEVSEPHSEAEDTVRVKLLSLPSAQEMKPPKLKKRNQNPPAAAKPVRCGLATLTSFMQSQKTQNATMLKKVQSENKGRLLKLRPKCQNVRSKDGSDANLHPVCVYCRISFCTRGELSAHASHNHKAGEVYDCDECGRVMYMSGENWIQHTKSHQSKSRTSGQNDGKVVSVETCPDISNIGVGTNLPRMDAPSRNLLDDSFHCEYCPRSFHLKESYIRHRRIHTGERPYLCTECGKDFRNPSGLTRHRKDVHEGLKKFGCDLCGRHFASRATMEDHRRIHTGERPYVCDSCGKAFKSKASLYVHSRTHITTYPFPCSHCDKKFRRKQEFDVHFKIHTGEKPYVCDMCGKRFRVHYEMSRHRLVHSDEKPFECKQCGLQFRQKRYLRNHNISQHSGKPCDVDETLKSSQTLPSTSTSSVAHIPTTLQPDMPIQAAPVETLPPSDALHTTNVPFTSASIHIPSASTSFVPSFVHMPSPFIFSSFRD